MTCLDIKQVTIKIQSRIKRFFTGSRLIPEQLLFKIQLVKSVHILLQPVANNFQLKEANGFF